MKLWSFQTSTILALSFYFLVLGSKEKICARILVKRYTSHPQTLLQRLWIIRSFIQSLIYYLEGNICLVVDCLILYLYILAFFLPSSKKNVKSTLSICKMYDACFQIWDYCYPLILVTHQSLKCGSAVKILYTLMLVLVKAELNVVTASKSQWAAWYSMKVVAVCFW